jgi:hypothetical protein
MFQAKNMCAAQVSSRPASPHAAGAHLAAFPQANTLLISDHAGNARRIIDMAERLDKATPAGQNAGVVVREERLVVSVSARPASARTCAGCGRRP